MVAGLAALSMGRHLNPALWPRKNKELEEGEGYYEYIIWGGLSIIFVVILGQYWDVPGSQVIFWARLPLCICLFLFVLSTADLKSNAYFFFSYCFPVSFQSPLSIYRTPTPSLYLSSSAGKIRYFQTQHLITGARHSSPGLAKLEHLLLSVIGLVIHKTQIQAGRGTSRRVTFLVVWPY